MKEEIISTLTVLKGTKGKTGNVVKSFEKSRSSVNLILLSRRPYFQDETSENSEMISCLFITPMQPECVDRSAYSFHCFVCNMQEIIKEINYFLSMFS